MACGSVTGACAVVDIPRIAGPWVVVSALIGRLLDMTHDFHSFWPFLFSCFRLVQDVTRRVRVGLSSELRRRLARRCVP
jgi:hypothetical protein